MHGVVESDHKLDKAGNPAGGTSSGRGFKVTWQRGPMVDPATGDRREQNGAFVQDLVSTVIDRIEFYQHASLGRFNCPENDNALRHLRHANDWLDRRTRDREKRGVEGSHTA